MRSRRLKLRYAALAATDTFLASQNTTTARRLRYVTKPLLMPVLASSLVVSTPGRHDVLRQGTLAAQAFSWGGDLALMRPGTRGFLTGVGSFFAAHACYVAAFASARQRDEVRTTGLKAAGTAWAAAAPIMAIAAGRKDPGLRAPIAAYAGILATMFATSTILDQELPTRSRRGLVAGTSLFMLSDSLLGVREFLTDEHHAKLDAAVMATYAGAQYLISDAVASAR